MKPLLLSISVDEKLSSVLVLTKPGDDVPPFAVVGEVDTADSEPDWRTFRRNTTFVEFFSRYMRGELARLPVEQANVRPYEWVYVIDARAPDPHGDVAWHDVVGWYKAGYDGAPEPETFKYNPKHTLVTGGGAMSGILSDESLWAGIEAAAREISEHRSSKRSLPWRM